MGDDILAGGAGANLLTGGRGSDTFYLSFRESDIANPKQPNVTTIKDFKVTEGDVLETEFDFAVYRTLRAAVADESFDAIVYESSTGKFWYDDDGAAGTDFKPICFAVCVGLPTESLV